MPKAYESKNYEKEIYTAWEQSGFFNPDNLEGEPFTIMMPPPNVTGILHLGHALENTLMDTMIRYQRMRGKKALLLPGTDHAAIATQAKVEKMLIADGMTNPRKELGREKLVAKIREFADGSMSTILSQIRTLGTSCDWSRLAYTFDDKRNVAVRELFTRMYNDGLIYRGYRVVNWSTKGQSTCSDDEIEHMERPAKLYTFKYAKDFPITIATTRPETKLGDTAVAVHPTDDRYKQFIGQTFIVDVGAAKPLEIKVIADEEVDPKFGTGALGVTPAHSPVDFAMYEKQKAKQDPIGIIPVIGTDGLMTEEAGKYVGLSVEDARAKFIVWLSDQGLLEKEEDIVQNVGTSDRYGDVIESLPMTQWWLDVNKEIPSKGKTLRVLMREAVTTGLDNDSTKKVTITPDRFTKLYLDRIDNLRDWCLSRQLWWGHRIPVWYRGEEMHVGVDAPEGEGWEQDPDTLDTWFSSGSWTFSTLGWPNDSKDLKTYHPTNWMQMGYEILYLWLMRMVMTSVYTLDDIPFHDAYIHGMLRDKEGKKFSKSAGNGIDPIDVINEYGADALRFSVISGISPGNDSRFYDEKVEGAQHLVNKLWNISRFILTSVGEVNHDIHPDSLEQKTLADKWILSRFRTVAQEVTNHFDKYEFSQAAEKLRDFTWSEFADWYIEIAKGQREGDNKESTDRILVYILEHLMAYWHPFIPFVTEVIWKQIDSEKMLMVHEWPIPQGDQDKVSEESFTFMQGVITNIRNIRSEYNVEPAKKINVMMVTEREIDEEQKKTIKRLARLEKLDVAASGDKPDGSASIILGSTSIFIPLAGMVDIATEKARLQKELDETEKYLKGLEAKLGNTEFTSKAPDHVIDKMKTNKQETESKKTALKEQLNSLS